MGQNNYELSKVLIFGLTPPPYGGVTKSVENLISSLKAKNIQTKVFSIKEIFKFKSYDIAHVHYSNIWKVFFYCLLGHFYAKKVILTKHGHYYNISSFAFKLVTKVTDGAIFLNEVAFEKYCTFFKKSYLLSSLFEEGFSCKDNNTFFFEKEMNKKYLLVYANNAKLYNGEEIYGVNFLLKNLQEFPKDYRLILLDPSKSYSQKIKGKSEGLIYIDYPVNFISLLKQSDVYIRPTSTDGSSVAIHEAILSNTPVVASNSVPRPQEVITYTHLDFVDLVSAIRKALLFNQQASNKYMLMSIESYIDFSEKLLNEEQSIRNKY